MPTGFYNDQEAVIAAKEAYNMTPKIVKIDNATKEIIKVLKKYKDVVIVGGRNVHGGRWKHQPDRKLGKHKVEITQQQTGYSMMLRRKEWDEAGFFPNYNEDSWISFTLQTHFSKKTATINPPVLIHCGYTRIINQNKDAGQKTYDWATIKEDMKKYPNITFE